MNACCNDDGTPSKALEAPRRNRYFYGKLLDVSHFQMEQDWAQRKPWLLNRLSLGQGILCGLNVSVVAAQVCVDGGVAIDGWGREIIVPGRFCLDPWKLPVECGQPAVALTRDAPHRVRLALCYRECVTEQMPVQVSDCHSTAACEAGTTIETFCLSIVEGSAPPPGPSSCAPLHLASTAAYGDDAAVAELIREQLCAALPSGCEADDAPCVVLAEIELRADGTIGELVLCPARRLIYSNARLLDMILCLAARVEACCGSHGTPTPTPTPTSQPTPPTPTPPPPVASPTLRIADVRFADLQDQVIGTLVPDTKPTFKAGQQLHAIVVEFTLAVARPSVVTGAASPAANPKSLSFIVVPSSQRFPLGYVPGEIVFTAPQVAEFRIVHSDFKSFPAGGYEVRLFGDADPTPGVARPAITATDLSRLDGEVNPAFPSGNQQPGGNFVFAFNIV